MSLTLSINAHTKLVRSRPYATIASCSAAPSFLSIKRIGRSRRTIKLANIAILDRIRKIGNAKKKRTAPLRSREGSALIILENAISRYGKSIPSARKRSTLFLELRKCAVLFFMACLSGCLIFIVVVYG